MNATPGRGASARIWRILAGILAGALILAALLLGTLRFAISRVPDNAARIQGWVERQTQLRLEFTNLDARLHWGGPELVLRDLRVLDRDSDSLDALFVAREGTVALDAWSLFRTGELVAGRLRFVGPEVTVVRLADGRIRLLGQRERPADRPLFDFERLPAGRLEVVDARVHFRDLATGRGPWTLERTQFALRRGRNDVEVAGTTHLPAAIGTRAEFGGRLRGRLDRIDDLDGRLTVRVAELALAGLADFTPARFARPEAGTGTASVEIAVSRGRLEQLRLTVDLQDVALALPQREVPAVATVRISQPYRAAGATALRLPVVDKNFEPWPAHRVPRTARYAALAGTIDLRRQGESWRLCASNLRLDRVQGAAVGAATLAADLHGHLASAFDLRLDVSRIAVADTWPLVLAVAPPEFDRWAGLDPGGVIRDLHLELVRERAGSEPRFALGASIDEASVRASGRSPGVRGLTATISGTDERGRIALDGKALTVEWPRLFRDAFAVEQASAEVDWHRDGQAWVFEAPQVGIVDPRLAVHGRVGLQLEGRGRSPVLDLEMRIDRAAATAVRGALPVGHLQPRSIVWLEQAFRAGTARDGVFVLRGPLRRFPFRNGEGEFLVRARVEGAELDYFPGFTPLTATQGVLEFHNEGMAVSVTSASVGGLHVHRVEAAIPDLRDSVLDVDATMSGDVAEGLAVLQRSPLGPRIGRQFMQLVGGGPAEYEFRMTLPMKDLPRLKYAVHAQLERVSVASPILRAPATAVTGLLAIDGNRVRAERLRGTFLDGPFELSIEPAPAGRENGGSVAFTATGRLAGSKLPGFIRLPPTIRMSGTADWRLAGRLDRPRGGGYWPGHFEVESDLVGLGIEAPSPFAKPPSESRPTDVRLELPQPGRNALRLQSGALRAVLAFAQRSDGRWGLERGGARFDGQPVALPSRAGVSVTGDWPDFDLAEWLALRASSPGRGQTLSEWLGPVHVRLERARLIGFEFRDLVAQLDPRPDAWHIDVAGPQAEGVVTVPVDLAKGAAIRLEMRRLLLEGAPRGSPDAAGPATDPRSLPAFTVRADDFGWQGRRFGRLAAAVRQESSGLRLESLETAAANFNARATGTWFADDAGTHSRLNVEFASSDLAAAARDLGYNGAIDAKDVRASGRFTWPGGPGGKVVARLDGTLHLELRDGQLKSVEPGAGRMLGLMSLAQLPRRLALDFRDVTTEGLAFDSVTGDFELRAGNASTQNLLLKGSVVDIGITGRTGLAAEDYDQTVVVSGNPTGPITVAGAIAGGPVGAAGALLFSQMFKGQLEGLTRVYYRVTGPWANPRVERIAASASDDQAAAPPAVEASRP